MNERVIKIGLDEYRELLELKGRVKSAVLLLNANEYAPREVLGAILEGKEREGVTEMAITQEGAEDVISM